MEVPSTLLMSAVSSTLLPAAMASDVNLSSIDGPCRESGVADRKIARPAGRLVPSRCHEFVRTSAVTDVRINANTG